MEMRRRGNSYTVDTLRLLKEIYGPSHSLYFISGTDTIHDLHNWNNPEEILSLCQFIGATRPDGSEQIDSIISSFGELGKTSSNCPCRPWKSLRQNSGAASAWACPSAI